MEEYGLLHPDEAPYELLLLGERVLRLVFLGARHQMEIEPDDVNAAVPSVFHGVPDHVEPGGGLLEGVLRDGPSLDPHGGVPVGRQHRPKVVAGESLVAATPRHVALLQSAALKHSVGAVHPQAPGLQREAGLPMRSPPHPREGIVRPMEETVRRPFRARTRGVHVVPSVDLLAL